MGGEIHKAIRSICQNTCLHVQLNSEFTDWFTIDKGFAQCDTLSPTLCNCFLNPLLKEIKAQCINVKFGSLDLGLLGYVAD